MEEREGRGRMEVTDREGTSVYTLSTEREEVLNPPSSIPSPSPSLPLLLHTLHLPLSSL